MSQRESRKSRYSNGCRRGLIGCTHPRLHKAGFTRSKRRSPMWRCAVCKRTSIDPKNFRGPLPRKQPVPIIERPCAQCGKAVLRSQGRGAKHSNWFCNERCCRQFHNDQLVIRRAKWGKRRDRAKNDAKRWTIAEDDYLRANSKKLSYVELALALERGPPAIKARCLKLGVGRKNYWTRAEENFLIANQARGWKWCAEQIGRSRWAVSIRANAIGLHLRRWLTADDKRQAKQLHAQGLSNQDIAEALGYERGQSVVYQLRRLGLKSNPHDLRKSAKRARATTLARHGALGGTIRARKRRQAAKAAAAAQLLLLGKELRKAMDKANARH